MDPTPESVAQGTVRMDEHPDYPADVRWLAERGFRVVTAEDGPRVVVRAVYDAAGRELLRVEQEVRVPEGMRYLDFEHELGHVRQVTDPARFPEGLPVTEAVRERPNGSYKPLNNAPGVMKRYVDAIAEYHVRLEEYIRLAERGVDQRILETHASGVDQHRARYQREVLDQRSDTPRTFARERFPDIRDLERRVNELRAATGDTPAVRPPPPDGSPLAKDDGDPATPRPDEDGPPPPDTGRDGPMSRTPPDRAARGPDGTPPAMIPVDGPPLPERMVEAPGRVAAIVDRHVADLVAGRIDDGGLPERAVWDADRGLLRVTFADGLTVDVRLQVNSALPPGQPMVLRPSMELVDGVWHQTSPAGVVLPAHVPEAAGIPAEGFVRQELDGAWRALHDGILHVTDPVELPRDPVSGYQLRPRDLDFLGLTEADFRALAARESPLGMTPEVFREWRESLYEALRRDGVPADAVDIRIRGSSTDVFSGRHKTLPTPDELTGEPLARLNEWLGDDPERPTSRPFDAMHRLGLEEPSDYDINFSSDRMFDRVAEAWHAEESPPEPLRKDHGYAPKRLVYDEFPSLGEWKDHWEGVLGREMSYAVFDGNGPADSTHLGFHVHFRDSDFVVRPPGPDPVPRYVESDLSPTGQRSGIYGTELWAGEDGRSHFPGDRIGTFRDDTGRLFDAETGRWLPDDNRPPTDEVPFRATEDLATTRRYDPADPESLRPEARDAAEGVLAAVAARDEMVRLRADLWRQVEPLVARVDEATGDHTAIADIHQENLRTLVEDAHGVLDLSEIDLLLRRGQELADANVALVLASEELGRTGGALVRAQEFGDHPAEVGGAPGRGSAGELDRALARADDPSFVSFEEKGVGGGRGTRLVDDPGNPDGARLRAEQGSPEYLRHMLRFDNRLAAAVRADPALLAVLDAAVAAGHVRYLYIRTSDAGVVTVTDFRLDPSRLRLDDLTVLPDHRGES